ncbi:SLC26A/SulP transporter family protein [Herbaspirillum sp. alder98]|uniref:SLC26A/SulP transporter family protein n=1 Tax=Herbaspirillum sp. alder98 TaxID=2913096 RepID=UPI001CD8E62F|nr:SulP family inorganic anion transporter [Herbaspirillum sp. alder98]MCA1322868.1 cyclic nucleotide-binding domain-containing protein [Herbaspirillum sp. alder98]
MRATETKTAEAGASSGEIHQARGAPAAARRGAGWWRHLPAALVLALISLSYAASYGAMIFGSGGPELLVAGLPILFVTTCVAMLMQACSSTVPFVVAGPDSNSVGILALMVGGIWSAMEGASTQAAVVTALAAVAVSTLMVGALMLGLGAARRGNLVQFVPFPVLGGFLAGSGYLLWTGAFSMLTGHAFSLDSELTASLGHLHWVTVLPAALVAVVMLGLPGRKFRHPLAMPGALAAATALFYASLAGAGMSLEQARELGWLFRPLHLAGLQVPATWAWGEIDWQLLLSHYSEFLATAAVMTLTILLNATSIGLATRREIDFNQELRSAGVANIVASALGGVSCCHSLSRSLLNFRFGSRTRAPAIMAALICLACMLFFLPLVSYLPRPVLAGLLIGLGGGLLDEWLIKARHRLGRGDYSLIWLILAVIAFDGFVTGVALGIVVACVLFVVEYGRVSCVKMEFTGAALHSKRERTMEAGARLKNEGDKLFGVSLQGFLFFGSANQMVNRVRFQLLRQRSFVVVDFRHVQGMDASTSQSFAKLAQLCEQHQVELLLSGMAEHVVAPIRRAFLDRSPPREFIDLDAALEWVEERLLGQVDGIRTGEELLVSLQEHFGQYELQVLLAHTEKIDLDAGIMLFAKGEIGDCMYFIEEGQVSVSLQSGSGRVRLRTFSTATIVGEMALYSGQKRTADVVTDLPTRAYKLSMARLRQLEHEQPAAALQLHHYVVRIMASRLAATNEAYRLTQ